MTTPFEPAPFPMPSVAPAPNTVERPKRKRKPRERKAQADKPVKTAAPKKVTKKKAAAKPKSDTISVSLKDFATMRAGDHAKLFLKVHKLLVGESKAARKVVLTEIAKVLA